LSLEDLEVVRSHGLGLDGEEQGGGID